MTRVDFYVLTGGDIDEKERLGCKLIEKAYRLGHRVYVLTPDADAARRMDDLLWVHQAGSFVPHALSGGTAPESTPVLIGHLPPPAGYDDVLLSLAPDVPECFSRFARVAELVACDDTDKARSRARFKFYKERGYPLHTHNLAPG